MELEHLSVEGISLLKQGEVGQKAGVKLIKGANEQTEAVASILFDSIRALPPETGKGQRLNVKA